MMPPQSGYENLRKPPKKTPWLWIILGFFGLGFCFCGAIGAAILLPVFASAKVAAQRTLCLSNVKQLSIGSLMYASDADEHFPTASRWMDKLDNNYVKGSGLFKCPVVANGYGYGMNQAMSEQATSKVQKASKTVLLFESTDTGRNADSDLSGIAQPGRHGKRDTVGYADGHCRSVEPSSILR